MIKPTQAPLLPSCQVAGFVPSPPEAPLNSFEPPDQCEIFTRIARPDLVDVLPGFESMREPHALAAGSPAAGSGYLEQRGVTSHAADLQTGAPTHRENTTGAMVRSRAQGELWSANLIHKESVVAKLTEAARLDLADPLARCHTELTHALCTGCQDHRTFWNRCDLRHCPCCIPRLATERRESVEWWVKMLPNAKHVVLTVRNSAVLTRDYVVWFKDCLAKLRRRAFARNWRGGLYSLETTNEGRGWHLHAHLLVDAGWIDQRHLATVWASIVGQDFAIVHVKASPSSGYLNEVAKYLVKGSQLATWTGADIATFIDAFNGLRTFGVFGTLYGKRTEWAEWIATLADERGACECGCSSFRYFDANEWEWFKIKSGGNTTLEPPTLRTLCLDLF